MIALNNNVDFLADMILDNRKLITVDFLTLILTEGRESRVVDILMKPLEERPLFISAQQA